MNDKSAIRRQMYRLKRIKTWQLIVIFVLMLVLSATFLRLNNIGMIERRDAVIAADKTGDSFSIQNRIYDLQEYSSSRMNASTGPVYLTEQYKRDTEALVEQRRSEANSGETIFSIADDICKQRFAGYSQAYVQCVANEIAAMPDSVTTTEDITLPSPSLYRYNFASPDWSPDFAGFSVLVTTVIGLIIVIRMIIFGALRMLLKRQSSGV